MTDPAPRKPRKLRPSGSERRRRTKLLVTRHTPEKDAALRLAADAHGRSLAALFEHAVLGVPLPPRRSGRIDQQQLAIYLEAVARTGDAQRASTAELGKSGSNLNQIAKMLNADTAPGRILNLIEDALKTHVNMLKLHEEMMADVRELRTLGMRAFGYERPGAKDDEI